MRVFFPYEYHSCIIKIYLYSCFSAISSYFQYVYNTAVFKNLSAGLEAVLSIKIRGMRFGAKGIVKKLGIEIGVKL